MWDTQFEELLRGHLPFFPTDDTLANDTQLRDFGLDSLGMVELLASLESTYDVRFRDDALTMETFETPGVLWKTLNSVIEPSV